ncbi:MAG: HAMP domain-containing histidine kinase [Ruminiclostridium sp.]|nr:HAMP domain-containing histidine kinase [Ruminiclostridium sp.]
MSAENKHKKRKAAAFSILQFVVILFFSAFVVTASFFLFFSFMEAPTEKIQVSAISTLGNVIFISVLMWVFYSLYKKMTVDKPVKRIISGLKKITGGDFSERIQTYDSPFIEEQYDVIIENINKMSGELAGVETLRTDFISNVSHEMKTPLAVIQNYAALLKSPQLDETDRLEYAQAIGDASKRLAALITNILKLNKLENQQIFPERKSYNLSEQICECLLEFETEWEKKNIEIETDINDDIMISADSELLSLVWNNLFSNALKFTDEGGTVSISAKWKGDTVQVSVTDTGCGIDSETGKHIFDKFYQGDTSHAARGNGLGLALVKRIIDITGSQIAVDSEVGRGSTFTVTIPEKHA